MRVLAMQGGGCRSFFQLGLLATAELPPFDALSAVSASTAMACAHLLGIHDEAFARFAGKVRGNRRNFYPGRLLRGRRPTPHFAMYRDTVLECVSEERFARLRGHPARLRFLLALAPSRSRAAAVALAAVAVASKRRPPLVEARAVEVAELPSPAALADAILASSAFPPFTPLPLLDGRRVVDGGVAESVPLGILPTEARRTALLTRPAPWRPLPADVEILAPEAPLPVAIWDYADEKRVTETYDLGRRAGERLRRARAVSAT